MPCPGRAWAQGCGCCVASSLSPGLSGPYGFFSAKHTFLRKDLCSAETGTCRRGPRQGGPATECPVCHWPARSPPRQTPKSCAWGCPAQRTPSGVAGSHARAAGGLFSHAEESTSFKKQSPPTAPAPRQARPCGQAPAVVVGGELGQLSHPCRAGAGPGPGCPCDPAAVTVSACGRRTVHVHGDESRRASLQRWAS